jgi:molecular chaperone DnaJ
MEGYGEAGDYGTPNGDLFIEMYVLPHSRFERLGDNLEIVIEITPATAVLGTTVEIETIDKRHIDLKVPAGIQYNTALRISGEGVKRRGKHGDLLVRIKIITPKGVSGEVKDLYQKISELEGHEYKSGGIFSGIMGKKKGKK